MTETLAIGLLGLGRHGSRYARHLSAGDVPGLRLAAVWRRDREQGEQQAREWGCEFVAEMAALIAHPAVDAVIAVVPGSLNPVIARQAAESGKPMLLEKPLAATPEGVEAILGLARRARITVAQTLRFDPLTRALRERVASLGPVHGLAFEQRLEPRGLGWERDAAVAGGGVLIQSAVHTLDAVRWVLDADALELEYPALDSLSASAIEDHASLHIRVRAAVTHGKAILGQVAASKIARARQMRFTLHCAQGMLEADYVDRVLRIRRGRKTELLGIPEQATILALLQAWRDYLGGDGPNPVPAEAGAAALSSVFEAYRQAARRDPGG